MIMCFVQGKIRIVTFYINLKKMIYNKEEVVDGLIFEMLSLKYS